MADGLGVSKNLAAAVAAKIKGGLAVFVKTPELSPVKTRLAADIGAQQAAQVYEQLLAASAAMMRKVRESGAAVHWAVGEREGAANPRWREFPAVFTGDGGLGARLHNVYSFLRRRYGVAALAGADCPSLDAETVLAALESARNNIVAGPTADGGFYLFAAARPIPERAWTAVSYSRCDTLAQLLQQFSDGDDAVILPARVDVDDGDSLRAAKMHLPE